MSLLHLSFMVMVCNGHLVGIGMTQSVNDMNDYVCIFIAACFGVCRAGKREKTPQSAVLSCCLIKV